MIQIKTCHPMRDGHMVKKKLIYILIFFKISFLFLFFFIFYFLFYTICISRAQTLSLVSTNPMSLQFSHLISLHSLMKLIKKKVKTLTRKNKL